jgi:hypothetical protein
MIIGISGYKGSGKDTAASELIYNYGFIKCSFAKPLKEIVSKLFKIDMDILDGIYNRDERERRSVDLFNYSPRELLQIVGTTLRDSINKDIWVKAATDEALMYDNVVFTDVRFPNEVEFIKKYGQVYRIVRPGFMGDTHESETALDNYEFDKIISNDGNEQDLKNKIAEIAKSLKL